ncbi:Valine--tRNA ligase [Candidatus Rubidus massiliensis]|nr:Valine--tRNA ligase [Candidatus Rubidus massiliensis]
MSELAKAYDCTTVEPKWLKKWEEGSFFKVNSNSTKPPYCIVMPPPNVTGKLHMGHALVNTLQDILIRWKRMQGFEALWIPGTDHAGIATQTVVEKFLLKTTGKRRTDFARDEFLEHVWKWKEENQHHIINQLKRIGSSCDWSKQMFTMDEQNNRAVRVMFKKLFDAKKIYRGYRLVNWDTITQTALADDEVEYEERASFLWYFKYPLKDGSDFVTVATTRPETMLGDTAIAVSPKDDRYASWIGKTVIQPLTNREIPIIADHLVDPSFGTGMVKITPAHDPNDYQMGMKHNLLFINIMTPDGKINEEGGKFCNLSMEEARQATVDEMRHLGFLVKIEPHINRVGVSYRSKAVIEPFMSKQWFIKMDDFAEKLKEAVMEEKTRLIPKNWENTYYHWINNLQDWCISRQLWWGHRIPIWYHKDNPEIMICYDGLGLPPEVKESPNDWVQENDVLDTWFSSGLWPFSTLGWPENTPDFQKFYPTSVLVTGYDILFFWVARMMFMGELATGKLPFPEVYLHGLIYGKSYWRNNVGGGITYISEEERQAYDLGKMPPSDVQHKWEKMSKSKGNVIDPLEIIKDYGTDAMRMALCSSANQSREIDLERRKFEEFKNFANKIWNGARFSFLHLDGSENLSKLTPKEFEEGLDFLNLKLEDYWILTVLNNTVEEVLKSLENYQFDQAALKSYDFFWKEFCAYYLEIAKPVLFGKAGSFAERKNKQKILAIILSSSMRLLHPIAPFITEEIFGLLKDRLENTTLKNQDPFTQDAIKALKAPICALAPYPNVCTFMAPEKTMEDFQLMESVVYTIRNIRGEMKLPPGVATDIYISGGQNKLQSLIQTNQHILFALLKITAIYFNLEVKGICATGVIQDVTLSIPIPEELIEKEIQRLEKEKIRLTQSLEKLKNQLLNEDFIARAPQALIEKQKEQQNQQEKELEEVTDKLKTLGKV